MPVWNTTKIVKRDRWIYRVQEEQFWDADFPGLGHWTGKAWYKKKPPTETSNIGNTGGGAKVNPTIAAQEFPGFASVSMPGVLRIAYPGFIHYEFYVPVDEDNHLYVGVMAHFEQGLKTLPFYAKYLGAVRWLFHGQFSGQDKWMVEVTDAPPEKLYRPDDALLQWRKLAEDVTEERVERLRAQGLEPPTLPRWKGRAEMGQLVLGVGASHSTLMNTHWDKVVHTDRPRRSVTRSRSLGTGSSTRPGRRDHRRSNHFRGFWLD